LLLGLLVMAGAASAAERSRYAGWGERNIKALSPQQLEDYLEGRGMSMALPAELNGYPGPRHVLDLADELDLTADQLARTRRLFYDMRLQAIELGEQIVAREALLEGLFASGTASKAERRRRGVGALARAAARAPSRLPSGDARSAGPAPDPELPAAPGLCFAGRVARAWPRPPRAWRPVSAGQPPSLRAGTWSGRRSHRRVEGGLVAGACGDADVYNRALRPARPCSGSE
jgi:hypothetical protein